MKTKNILKAIKVLRKEVQIGKDSFMSTCALETLERLYKELANKVTLTDEQKYLKKQKKKIRIPNKEQLETYLD
jgi:hypothetical protein